MRHMPSRVAIVGAGPIGCAAAAFLVQDGMAPALWSPTGSRVRRHADRASFTCAGAVSGEVEVEWLASPQRLAEFFGLWTFAIQLAAVIGPLTYGLVTWLTQGNHRLAILITGVFFVAGLLLLARVDLARGIARRDAAVPASGIVGQP